MRFNHKREYEWLIISQSYFQCAIMSARILKEELSKFARSEDLPLDKIYGDYLQTPDYLIFPILFNFKHGIEIYLKSIIGMANSEFPKHHNLLDLLEKSDIRDEKIKCIIRKYALGHLFLPSNKERDTENQFERYPQGSPYDNLELFLTANQNGQAEITRIVNQEKISELIEDIKFVHENIRKTANAIR